ncbi:MAG: TlpA disulfide reductase family protein [Thiohalobacterales bacterium]|nr:TlpA disulfide reductase family protein [Thiohalobacterales bacterium]
MTARHVTALFILLASLGNISWAGLLPTPDELPAPALSLPDLGGRQHTLSDYRGQVVLVNFWATWCGPCLVEMPGMQRLQSAMQGRPFAILAVNAQEARTRVWRFKEMLQFSFPALLDSDGSINEAWEVDFYPTSFLIDAVGRIRYTAYGMIEWDSDETRRLIEQLMPDAQAETRSADTGSES